VRVAIFWKASEWTKMKKKNKKKRAPITMEVKNKKRFLLGERDHFKQR